MILFTSCGASARYSGWNAGLGGILGQQSWGSCRRGAFGCIKNACNVRDPVVLLFSLRRVTDFLFLFRMPSGVLVLVLILSR